MGQTYIKVATLWFLMLATIVGAIGQEREPYRLREDDTIHVQIYNEASVNSDAVIGKDGLLSLPYLDPMYVEGMTLPELRDILTDAYSKRLRLRDPKISVTLVKFRTLKVSASGFVKGPGLFELRPGDTILTLLSKAGGPDWDRADLRRATLRRKGSDELIPIDLHAMLNRADTSQNYLIEDGDTLNVPEANNKVIVIGQVPKPGPIPYKEPLTVQDALAQAGGEIPTRSWLSRTQVIRERPGMPGTYDRIQVDIVRFIKKGDDAQNILLQPGDIVYVPETKTPDVDRISRILGSLLFFRDFFRGGLFRF
jgi:polysaccharide export outer membrane protein